MSKHSRARRHHSLHITDPRWATPTYDPTGPIKTNPPGLPTSCTDPAGPTETSTRTSNLCGLPNINHQSHLNTAVSP
ncbi:hypothetical protein AVEN_163122-1 [Araneus ventricosus]|uniref:Uncharacterized protein n=1 Tax=Araneus ventricosus TaxID=182803 RepID=A0A4Y2DHA0_ARAVE|nr:hypothetical protein AVEN_163122-1 [Araneus ventricosus]